MNDEKPGGDMKSNCHYSDKNQIGLDWMARNLGFENIHQLAQENGYDSPDSLAKSFGVKDPADIMHAPDFAHRVDVLRKK